MPEDDRWRSEEFDCPPGRVTVDLIDDGAAPARGIMISYYEEEYTKGASLEDAMMPTHQQWNYVKYKVMEWLDEQLKEKRPNGKEKSDDQEGGVGGA